MSSPVRKRNAQLMRQIERAISISDRLVAWNMLESASGVLERALEKHPYNPDLLRRLGRIRLAQGLPQEAIPFLKLAIAHDQMSAPIAPLRPGMPAQPPEAR